MFSRRLSRFIAAGAAVIAIGGSTYGIVSATASNGSGTPTSVTSSSATSGSPLSGAGSNARSGPAAGGTLGTIASVSKSGFTVSTSAGQKVTVDEASSTTAIKKGERV